MSTSGQSFADLLVSVAPRERSGARSSNRFSFQHSYALGLVLELHEKIDDYCVLFDIHEDVFVLNSSVNPTYADVYQIKTDATTWTGHSLTKRERNRETGEEKPSVLGNLYVSYIQFPGFIKSMSFVATAQYNIPLADDPQCGDRETFCIMDIEETERKKIHTRIANEHNVSDPPDGHGATHLVRTSLSVRDHERHTEGIVSDFLSRQGDGMIPPAPFHRTLRSELRRKNDNETNPITFGELTKLKGVTRNDFQAMIDSIPTGRAIDDLTAIIRSQLVKEGYNLGGQIRLNNEIRRYLAQRLDATNAVLSDAVKRVGEEIAQLPQTAVASGTPIADTLTIVGAVQCKEFNIIRDRYSDTFLQAMITVAIYEQPELPATHSQPAEKST